MRDRGAFAVLAVSATLLVACDTSPTFERAQYGIVNIAQLAGEDADFELEPVGFFFVAERAALPDSRTVVAACTVAPAEPGESPMPDFERLNAGDTLRVTSGGSMIRLPAAAEERRMRYERTDDPPLAANAGAAVTVTVPGATGGFPAASATIAVLTDPAFEPIDTPGAGEPLTISWTPGDAAGAVRVALRYTPPGGGEELLVCLAPDTGTLEIPAGQLGGWIDAPPASRSASGGRWRSEITVTGARILALYMQQDVSLAVAP